MSPMKRGKCREATKGGATLPKVVAMSIAKLTDEFPEGWFTNPIYIIYNDIYSTPDFTRQKA